MSTTRTRNRIVLFGRLFPDAGVEELIALAAQLGYGGIDFRCDGPLSGGGQPCASWSSRKRRRLVSFVR